VRKVVLVSAGIVISVVVLSVLYVDAIASAKWAALRERVLKIYSDAKDRELTRPVLRGEPLPGNAWDEYSLALASHLTEKESWDLGHLNWEGGEDQINCADAILSKYKAALDHLRTGVRRTEGRFPYVWEEGIDRRKPLDLHPNNLKSLATFQARLLRAKGDSREAALLVLDLLQFTRDCAANGTHLSENYISGWGELRDLLMSGTLSSQDAKEISRELKILEDAFPRHGDLLMNWNAWLSKKELEGAEKPKMGVSLFGGGDLGISRFALWRYSFSERIAIADAQGQIQEWYSKIATQQDRPWSEEKETLKELGSEMDRSKNSLVRAFHPIDGELGVGSWWQRYSMTWMRGLRIAAEYLDTGKVLDLDDPFGGRLKCEISDGKLTIWSISVSGKKPLIEVRR